MLVAEKLTDSPYVEKVAHELKIKEKFLLERIRIFKENGYNRETLFKIDTGDCGLALWRHRLVEEADAILLGWINQGLLSLHGIKKILTSGKPVVWTMHDYWCMTGICHIPYTCTRYEKNCGNCPLLGKKGGKDDLSHKIWVKKEEIYKEVPSGKTAFVAVSNRVAEKAGESSLLKNANLKVIHNPFKAYGTVQTERFIKKPDDEIRLLLGAARIDDPVKGFPILLRALELLRERHPETAARMKMITFGYIKDPGLFERMAVDHSHLGLFRGEETLKNLYESNDIVISASHYETLGSTLMEAQAYGCIPVSFDSGGQTDIIEHGITGFLAHKTENDEESAKNLAGEIYRAAIETEKNTYPEFVKRMKESVKQKFSEETVADAYLSLIKELQD